MIQHTKRFVYCKKCNRVNVIRQSYDVDERFVKAYSKLLGETFGKNIFTGNGYCISAKTIKLKPIKLISLSEWEKS